MVCSEVMIERTISTSGSTGTGLKKCMPSTRSGFEVSAASFMIGTDEVVEARKSASGAFKWNVTVRVPRSVTMPRERSQAFPTAQRSVPTTPLK